jgi:hypothetical protein
MLKIVSVCILSFFIWGCSKNITIDKLDPQRVGELSIVNTRKGELESQNSKIIILATYLNPIKTSDIDKSKENFLISIYLSKKDENKKGYNNPFYQMHLNDNILIDDIKVLDKKAKILKVIPTKNRWSEYYLVQFPKQKTKTLKITFENAGHSKTTLTFSKDF